MVAKPAPVAKPVPVAVARVQPQPQQVVRRVAAPTVVQPVQIVAAPRVAPAMVAPVVPVAKVQAASTPRVAAPAGCAGASSVSARYMASSTEFPVRCGPQTQDHVTRVTTTARVAPQPGNTASGSSMTYVYPVGADVVYVQRTAPVVTTAAVQRVDPYKTYVAPRRVYRSQIDSTRGIQIPDGYQRVWMDGRLNPQRAHQTYAGMAQMDLTWTKTVPRYLIERGTGREVTAQYPGLIYPYTSYAEQNRAQSVVSSKGSVPVAAPAPVAVKPQQASSASHSYVQAGVFQSRDQAQQAAQRLASTGLTTRLGTLHSKGSTYSVVLSGPYSSQASLNAALTKTRSAGFGNAVLRN
jgi:hypothetical protein